MSNNSKKFLILLGGLIILALILQIFFINKYRHAAKETKDLYETATKDADIYRNKYNQSVGEIEAIRTQKLSDFTDAIFKDSAMIRLQQSVAENQKLLKKGGTANNFSSGTTIDRGTTNNTYITSTGDTARRSSFSDKWIDYTILSFPDTTFLNLKTFDQYSVINGYEKDPDKKGLKKLFSRRNIPFSKITSESPYSEITEVKTYAVEMTKPSRWGLDGQAGITWTISGFKPYVGVGVGYRLIEFNSNRTAR